MASGHVNRIYRPNTWLHRPTLHTSRKSLPTRSRPHMALNGLAISPDACLLLKAKQTSRGLHTHSLVPIAATASNPDEQNRDAAATNDCLNYGQTCGKRDTPSHPPVKPCTPQHRRHGNKSRSEIQRCVRLNARMVFRKQQYYAIQENQPERSPRQRRGFGEESPPKPLGKSPNRN